MTLVEDARSRAKGLRQYHYGLSDVADLLERLADALEVDSKAAEFLRSLSDGGILAECQRKKIDINLVDAIERFLKDPKPFLLSRS